MKKVNELTAGDHIAFGFNYNKGEPNEIVVAPITSVHEDIFIVHFLHGYKSLSEEVRMDDVIAIGNLDGDYKIRGWGGRYDLVKHILTLNKAVGSDIYLADKMNDK